MEYKMSRAFFLFLYILSLFGKSYTWTEKLSVENGGCSTYKIRHVNNDHQYEIDWNGGQISSFCSFGFIGRDSGYQNDYKVCIDAIHYRVSDCVVEMRYETGISSILQKKYSCNDTVKRFCGDSNEFVDVEFDTKFVMPIDNAGKITLKVTADMTYNFALTVGASVAGAVVGVIIISLCVTFFIRQRNRRTTGIFQSTSTPYSPQTNEYTYPQQNVANPHMYPHSQQYAALPPSYQDAVTTSGNLASPVAGTNAR